MKRVSILVPMYGVEKYIEQCARSLFSQSYTSCEYIFVDDASPDNSLALVKRLAERYSFLAKDIKFIELPTNGGVAAARNAALDAATGDYLLFVDADDWVDDFLVQKLVAKAERTGADICNAWCESVDDTGYCCEQSPAIWLKGKRSHLKAILGQSHLVPNHVRGMLFRRSLFEENGLRFTPGVDFGEDYSLLPQIVYHSKRLCSLREYLYFYRVANEGSYMNNISTKHIRSYVAAEAIVEQFISSLPDAAHYHRSLLKGKVNIKKWIFKRGANPSDYDGELFAHEELSAKYPLLYLYNCVVDSGNSALIKLLSVIVNLPLYLRRTI